MEIKFLDATVVDQIAAGEVIERPAQMAKELIENSLDAGADKVHLVVDEGGRNFHIEDNGHGMSPSDLELSVARHATSKISEAADLFKLRSFGFRGEALASISSISEIEITSRHKDASEAHKIKVKYGEKPRVLETSRNTGTSISISNLFENVPARKKFLKSDSAETTAIKNVVKAMAMVRPDVEFKLKSKGKMLLHYPVVETFHQRVEDVLEIRPMYYSQFEYEGFTAEIVYSAPNNTLRVNRGLWFFVQDRYVQDRRLQAAVMEAYRGLLMHGEFPYCVARIMCPTDEVDVNIHPTKSQVKFAHQDRAFRVVNRGLRTSMEQAPWIQKLKEDDSTSNNSLEMKLEVEPKEEVSLGFESEEFKTTRYPTKNYPAAIPKAAESKLNYSVESPEGKTERASVENVDVARSSTEDSTTQGYWSSLQPIGQTHLTYLICQSPTKMVIVDQHAAHERVMYERLMNHWKSGGVSIQQFLVPLTLNFSEEQIEVLLQQKGELEKLGILIDQAGPEAISIEGLPEGVKEKNLKEILQKFANDNLNNGGSFAIEDSIAHICATLACHSAIRAGQALSTNEISGLLKQMDEFPLSSFCPHGRPVYIEYPVTKLEKDFGRTL